MAKRSRVFSSREALVRALREAVDLEMRLMIQYLYAAYSIPNYATGEYYVRQGKWTESALRILCGDGEDRLDRGLRGTLLQIANEEMIHFLMVNNLLMAVGGPFFVPQPDFSATGRRGHLPTEMKLEPLSMSALQRFLQFERPAHETELEGLAPDTYTSVSGLYRMIRATFAAHPEYLVVRPGETGGEHHLFLTPKTNRVHPDYQCQVDDLDSALLTVDVLVEQGEGGDPSDPDSEDSHFRKFQRASVALENLDAKHLLYPCLTNPSQYERPGMTTVRDPDTLGVLRLFNSSFALSMQMMIQHFCLAPRTTLRRSRLMNASIDVMAYMLAPLSGVLMSAPSGLDGLTAGPSFELPYPLQFISDQTVAQRSWSREFRELAQDAQDNPLVPPDVIALLHEYSEYSRSLVH